MEVMLIEDYPSLGFVGDTVSVKKGFARNYLIPRGVAVEATTSNAKLLAHRMRLVNAKKEKIKAEAEEQGNKLKGLNIKFKLKVGEGGRAFGSIGTKDIEKFFTDNGLEIHRRHISLSFVIKTPGTYTVSVKLHSEVVVELKVEVEGDKAALKKASKKDKKEEEAKASEDAPAETEEGSEGNAEEGSEDDTESSEPAEEAAEE